MITAVAPASPGVRPSVTGVPGRGCAYRRQAAVTCSNATKVTIYHCRNVGRDKIYHLLRTGQLRSIKIGKLRRITEEHLAEFIASLENRPCE